MPRSRPQLSITLPRSFTFHYTEGEEPKTPEQELPVPTVPHSPHAYRIKRRSRPGVSNQTFDNVHESVSQDVPIPTIEIPSTTTDPLRPIFQQRSTEPSPSFLTPVASRPFMTAPRTPHVQRSLLSDTWNKSVTLSVGESISRPMSTCSLLSDSSDESDGSLESYQSKGGSCTSPDSDAPDPFGSRPIKKRILKERPKLETCFAQLKQSQTRWTTEMDKHLWTTYLFYLQDPTVTPFKLLPGVSPPLGVCHRVAREARRTWRVAKTVLRTNVGSEVNGTKSGESPDTITASRSGSNTPTGVMQPKSISWPKSGSSTRRRLRELCKHKPTIAPHYQRLLQSRSPSPFSSSPRSQIRSSRTTTPFTYQDTPSAFNTRDVQLSLMTSTAATMQPDGPLAQLSKAKPQNKQPRRDWFNDPIVPWASPTEIPSDLGHSQEESVDTFQLGSPFGFHTWGPSRSRHHPRPMSPRTHSNDVSTIGPTLRSPVRLHDTFPYPGVTKRRAQHQLEDELSPGGTDMRRELLENLFGGPVEGRHRRVRSRGFSLGDVNNEARLANLFTPPLENEDTSGPEPPVDVTRTSNFQPPPEGDSKGRLGSPFSGIARRPSRGPARHTASASLSAYDPSAYTSIEQRLSQTDHDELSRLFRGQKDAMNASIGFGAS